jgi:hypothetical protein
MFGSWLGVTPAAWARGGQVSDGPPLLQVGPTSGDLCVASTTVGRSQDCVRFREATTDGDDDAEPEKKEAGPWAELVCASAIV